MIDYTSLRLSVYSLTSLQSSSNLFAVTAVPLSVMIGLGRMFINTIC